MDNWNEMEDYNLPAHPEVETEYSSPFIIPPSISENSSPSEESINDQYSDVDEDLETNNSKVQIIDHLNDQSAMNFRSHDYQQQDLEEYPDWAELQNIVPESINTTPINFEPQSPLPSPWVKYTTVEGWTYYYNTISGESTWDAKDTFAAHAESEIEDMDFDNSHENSAVKEDINVYVSSTPESNRSSDSYRQQQQQIPLHMSNSPSAKSEFNLTLSAPMNTNVDLVNDEGQTALQIVCQHASTSSKQQMDCAAMLIESGARVNVYDSLGNSLLHYAVKSSNPQLVKYLLLQGADSDKLNNDGDSAVHVAAKLGNLECMQVLVLFRGGTTSEINQNQKGENDWSWQEELDRDESGMRFDYRKESTHEFNHYKSSASSSSREKKREKMQNFRQQQQSYNNGNAHCDSRMQFADTFHDTTEHFEESLAVAPRPNQSDHSQGWMECFSPEGARYYYNQYSKRVQWESPFAIPNPSLVIRKSAGQHSSLSILNSRTEENTFIEQNSSSENGKQFDYNALNHYQQPHVEHQEFRARHHDPNRKLLHQRNSSTSFSSSSTSSLSTFENAPNIRNNSQSRIPATELPPDNKYVDRSRAPSDVVNVDGESNSQRHLQVWSRFFENAVRLREDEDSALSDQEHSATKSSNKARNRNQRKRLKEMNYNDWPALIDESEYHRLLDKLLRTEGSEDDFPLPEQSLELSHSNKMNLPSTMMLQYVVMRGDTVVVEQLLSRGIDPSRVDAKLRSLVHFASKLSDSAMLALLLDYGADADIVDIDRRSPLHIAAFFGNFDVLRHLLENAVSVDRRDIWDNTPLHLAVHSRNVSCCRLLLEYGAKKTLRNRMGLDALRCAQLLEPQTADDAHHIVDLLSSHNVAGSIPPIETPVSSAPSNTPRNISMPPPKPSKSTLVGAEDGPPIYPPITSWPLTDSISNSPSTSTMKPLMLRIDTSRIPPPIATQFNAHSTFQSFPLAMPLTAPPPPLYVDPQYNGQTMQAAQYHAPGTQQEEEAEHEDGNDGVPDKLAGAVWRIASSLMNVAFSAFGSGNIDCTGKSLKGESDNDGLEWKNSAAPPTDAQLLKSGLGFRVRQPPAIVADELNAQVYALRTGLTPRRSNLSTPLEVVAAIDEKRQMQARRV